MHRPELDWPLDRFDKEPADIDSGYIDGGEPSFRLILFLPLRPAVPAWDVAPAHQSRELCQHSHNFNLHTKA